jgi:hypothetical protein
MTNIIERLAVLLRENGIECDSADPETVVNKVVFNFNLQKKLKEAWREDAESLKVQRTQQSPRRPRKFTGNQESILS